MKVYTKKSLIIITALFLFVVTACGNKDATPEVSDNLTEDTELIEDSGITIGELEDSIGTDVVLLMDESGSMVKADENRIAIEGAKLFIDMEKLTNANIALVEFSNKTVASKMVEMTQQNKEYLKGILA